MERKEELKQKLNELKIDFLCLNKDDPVFKSITERFKGKIDAIGVIDLKWNDKNPDGIVITENGIEWNAGLIMSHVSINGKKTTKGKTISFKELAHYECTIEDGTLLNKIQLNRTDLSDPNLLEISIDCFKDINVDQVSSLFKLFTQIETIDEIIPDEKKVEYLEAFIIEEDKNPIMRIIHGLIGTEFLSYKLPFAKYLKKSSWVFHYKHDLSNIVGWVFALLYRKVYTLGFIFLAIVLIAFYFIPEPVGIIIAVLLMAIQSMFSPFIIYKRYIKILKDCTSNNMTKEQTLDVLKKKGGSNGYLAVIAGVLIVISLISQIMSFING